MKHINKLLLCILSLSLITKVDAASISVGTTTVPASSSGSVKIELKGDDLAGYNKVTFDLVSSDNDHVTLGKFTYTGPFNLSNGDIKELTSESGLYPSNIGTIDFRTDATFSADFTITPTNVKFIKADGTECAVGTCSDASISSGTIKYEAPKSNDASLSSLTISQGELEPAFKSNIVSYTATLPENLSTIKLFAKGTSGATVTGTGTLNLEMGANNFEVKVVAEDGVTTKVYTITINRGEISTPSGYLKSLSIKGFDLSPEFDEKNNTYTVDVDGKTKSLDIKYTPVDTFASVKIIGNENFEVGQNEILITVKASDDSDTQVYKIIVNKEKDKDSKKDTVVKDVKKKKSNLWAIILVIILIILLIGFIIFLIIKKKKSGKNSKVKKEKPVKEKKKKWSDFLYDDEDEDEDDDDEDDKVSKKQVVSEDTLVMAPPTNKEEEKPKITLVDDEDELFAKTKEFNLKDFK